MIHFKYMGETIIEDDIQNGDWLLMSYNKTYYFNRDEFRDYCKEAHWDYLREITTIEIDEDRNRFVWIEWSELDYDMELAWLVEAVVTGKVKHYKHEDE